MEKSLNPCCSGRWSRTHDTLAVLNRANVVLILVVVEDGLVRATIDVELTERAAGLNPCCSGRWSRTRPYKTILINNKLKNIAKQFFTFLNRKLTFS